MTDELGLPDLPQPVEVTGVSPDSLSAEGDGPSEQDENTLAILCDYMRTHGWIGAAIVADTDGIIVSGEQCWRAARELEFEKVPVWFYDLTDEERRQWQQPDNINATNG